MIADRSFYSLFDVYLSSGRRICTDTRKLKGGEIFWALKGDRFDGNEYAEKALSMGACMAVVDNPEVCKEGDKRYLLVANTLDSLQQLAIAYRNTFDISLIGLTGSNGKTTTKELIYSVLTTRYTCHATKGNLNNHIGVPLTILDMPPETAIGIVEMGANQPGDIAELVKIAQPTHALITNIAEAHLEKLIDVEGVRRTKGAIFDFVRVRGGYVFVNEEDQRVRSLSMGIPQISYGIHSGSIRGNIMKYDLEGMEIKVTHPYWDTTHIFSTRISGQYNLLNILVAIAIGVYFDIPLLSIKKGIYDYVPNNSRSQLIEQGGQKIWMDAYNANPASMRAAISHVFAVGSGKIALVLGDMYELGPDSEEGHRSLGKFINNYEPLITIGVGTEMEKMIEVIKGEKIWFPSIEAAKESFRQHISEADILLLKGSRAVKLEELIEGTKDGQ